LNEIEDVCDDRAGEISSTLCVNVGACVIAGEMAIDAAGIIVTAAAAFSFAALAAAAVWCPLFQKVTERDDKLAG
jgi:hypothetical protein